MLSIADFPRYEAYKDSGVDWLNEIPSNWKVRRLKYLFREINERSESGGESLLSVSQYTGVTPKSDRLADGDLMTNAESLEGYKIVRENDLVSNIMLAWNGSLGFSSYNGIVSPAYSIYRLQDGNSHGYFHYLLRTDIYKAEYKRKSTGVIESRLRLYSDDFYDVWGLLPSETEQRLIAKFLDKKTTQIDEAIAIKEQQIALLKERKQIIIQKAVTQGLDPAVPMKDSGVDWIGEIPAHWECSAVKNFMDIPITDGPHTTPMLYDEGVPFVSAEAIKDGEINFGKIRGYISEKDYIAFSKKYHPKLNDIYMVKSGATTGRVAMVRTDRVFSIWSPLAVFRVDESKLDPLYFYYYLQSYSFLKGVELSWSFGTQQNIGMGVLGNLTAVVPTLNEQINISAYIQSNMKVMDKGIQSQKEQIEKLKEYKTTLINCAVTGKIRITPDMVEA